MVFSLPHCMPQMVTAECYVIPKVRQGKVKHRLIPVTPASQCSAEFSVEETCLDDYSLPLLDVLLQSAEHTT